MTNTDKTSVRPQRKKSLGARMKQYWQIYVLMGVGLLAYLIFRLLPLWGLSLAFVDFNIIGGLANSPFVGLKHFINLFTVCCAILWASAC